MSKEDQLREAMKLLFEGRAEKTDGALTWENVVKQCPKVSRASGYRGTESLRQEFKEMCAEKRIFAPRVPAEPLITAKPKAKGRVKDSPKLLRRTIGIMANHIQALSVHIDDLNVQLAKEKAASRVLEAAKAALGRHSDH